MLCLALGMTKVQVLMVSPHSFTNTLGRLLETKLLLLFKSFLQVILKLTFPLQSI
ncbi:hypothetical protein LINPERHAP1_LOCUS14044 [Linum perenne]